MARFMLRPLQPGRVDSPQSLISVGRPRLAPGMIFANIEAFQHELRRCELLYGSGPQERRIIRANGSGTYAYYKCHNHVYGCPFKITTRKLPDGGYYIREADSDDAHDPLCHSWTARETRQREMEGKKPLRRGPGMTTLVS